MSAIATDPSEAAVQQNDRESKSVNSTQSNRRRAMCLFASVSLALVGAAVAGCANMKIDPKPKRIDSHITGRGGGPGRR